MKKLILFTMIFALSMQSCRDSKIEIIPDYDNDYLTFDKVDDPVLLYNMEQEQTDLREIMQNAVDTTESKYNTLLEYRLYINEDGKIEKIKILNSKVKEIEREILQLLEHWAFNPAKLDGQTVKFRFDLKVSPKSLNDEKLIADFFDTQAYFIMVDEMPEPIGGIEAIQKNIIYPELAKKAGIQGRVFVKAYIDEQGDVSKVEIIKGIGNGCDESAIEAVKKIKFKPGMHRGKPVKVQVAIPIIFKLN